MCCKSCEFVALHVDEDGRTHKFWDFPKNNKSTNYECLHVETGVRSMDACIGYGISAAQWIAHGRSQTCTRLRTMAPANCHFSTGFS